MESSIVLCRNADMFRRRSTRKYLTFVFIWFHLGHVTSFISTQPEFEGAAP